MSDIRIPAPERPQPRRSAVDFINEINAQLVWTEHQKKPEQAVRISYGGAFGVMRAVRITPQGSDFLSILVRDGEGGEHTIVAPVFKPPVNSLLTFQSGGQPFIFHS